MFDISWDWIDGYLSAVRQIGTHHETPVSGSSNAAAWISAVGSIGAAGVAAYAAKLSWKAAQQSMQLTFENERSSLIQQALQTRDDCESEANKLFMLAAPI